MNLFKTLRLAGFAAIGFFAMLGNAQAASQPAPVGDESITCREITRHVAIWGAGNPSKLASPSRFETRMYRVCRQSNGHGRTTRVAAM